MKAYIEFWGIMQAIIIQQDAIDVLYESVIGVKAPRKAPSSAWIKIRQLRNLCAGHPANQSNGHRRTFMGRRFGTYNKIQYESFDAQVQQISHPTVDLENILFKYTSEAVEVLEKIYLGMADKWPKYER